MEKTFEEVVRKEIKYYINENYAWKSKAEKERLLNSSLETALNTECTELASFARRCIEENIIPQKTENVDIAKEEEKFLEFVKEHKDEFPVSIYWNYDDVIPAEEVGDSKEALLENLYDLNYDYVNSLRSESFSNYLDFYKKSTGKDLKKLINESPYWDENELFELEMEAEIEEDYNFDELLENS